METSAEDGSGSAGHRGGCSPTGKRSESRAETVMDLVSLTQKLLHLLQAHVDVHTRVAGGVGEVARVSRALDPLQQDEQDQTPELPQH